MASHLCKYCFKSFPFKSYLDRHYSSKKNCIKNVGCSIVNNQESNFENLYKNEEDRKYPEIIIKMIFDFNSIKSVNKENHWKKIINVFNETFDEIKKENLESQISTKINHLSCIKCNYTFSTKSNLNRHMKKCTERKTDTITIQTNNNPNKSIISNDDIGEIQDIAIFDPIIKNDKDNLNLLPDNDEPSFYDNLKKPKNTSLYENPVPPIQTSNVSITNNTNNTNNSINHIQNNITLNISNNIIVYPFGSESIDHITPNDVKELMKKSPEKILYELMRLILNNQCNKNFYKKNSNIPLVTILNDAFTLENIKQLEFNDKIKNNLIDSFVNIVYKNLDKLDINTILESLKYIYKLKNHYKYSDDVKKICDYLVDQLPIYYGNKLISSKINDLLSKFSNDNKFGETLIKDIKKHTELKNKAEDAYNSNIELQENDDTTIVTNRDGNDSKKPNLYELRVKIDKHMEQQEELARQALEDFDSDIDEEELTKSKKSKTVTKEILDSSKLGTIDANKLTIETISSFVELLAANPDIAIMENGVNLNEGNDNPPQLNININTNSIINNKCANSKNTNTKEIDLDELRNSEIANDMETNSILSDNENKSDESDSEISWID